MTKPLDSLKEDIEALRVVQEAKLDSTLEFVANTLVTSWLFLRRYVAKTGKTFEDVTAADLIEELRNARKESFPSITVVPKT